MTNEHELAWNGEIGNDGSDFALLPPGMYPFMVKGFSRERHTPSEGGKLPACPKAVLSLAIDGGSLGIVMVKDRLFLHTKTEGMICQFFKGIGAKVHGENIIMDWSRVPGSTGWCKIKNKVYQGETYNELASYIDADKAPGPAPSTAQFQEIPNQAPAQSPGTNQTVPPAQQPQNYQRGSFADPNNQGQQPPQQPTF